MVGKSEKDAFKVGNKLIAGESALIGWEGVELMTAVEWCLSKAKELRFMGREFHTWGDEFRNERSANFSLVETGEGKGRAYQRNKFRREG